MTHLRTKWLGAILGVVTAACTGTVGSTDPGSGSGSDFSGSGSGSGSDMGSGSGSDNGLGDPGTDPEAGVQPTYPTAHPRIYLSANAARLKAALAANRPAAVRLKGLVDSWMTGADIYLFSPINAALMSQLTGNAPYCTKAVATVDANVAADEAKIASGTQPVVAEDSYLKVGDVVGDLALVYDWCFTSVTASQKSRWLAYANQAVWNVWHPGQAKWGSTNMPWTGWATNDPSDNYYYSFMRATMMLGLAAKGEDTQADGWVTQFHDTKIMGQLVPTFNADLVGGGSREGTGYGVAMRNLWSLYDFWKATTGEKLAAKTPHTRSSILSFMHQMVPTLDRVAPTGDLSRDSTAAYFDYHRGYLQELMAIYHNDPLAQRAKTMLDTASLTRMGNSFVAIEDFLYDDDQLTAAPLDLNTTYYAKGIGELYSRSGWDKHATWINMIAGPYTQSHAHQDQGSLMIYKDGWLSYDAVVDSHSGLTQETTAHSLVRIDSGGQPVHQIGDTTSTLAALHKGADYLYSAADLTPAYNGNAVISKVNREIVYLQPNVIVVYDRVNSAAGTQQVWQLATPVQPSISGATATITNAGHTMSVQRLAPSASSSTHSMASESDYAGGYRLDETIAGGNQRYLHVISIDGAATQVSATGDSSVTLTVGGKVTTVAFNHDTVGATLTINGAATTLAPGVDTLAP
ncbi:MAG: Fibronectin type domain protein [Myxococcales bacterium]|nr:Fibronectin type domain protein [Myxococcales bacterium]